MPLHAMHQPDLAESEALYRTIFEHAAVGLAHGSTRGFILRVNRAFASMLGYRPEELQGQNFWDITHPHDVKLQMPIVRDLVGGHRDKVELEKRYIHRNGEMVWAIVTMSLARNPGGGEPYVIASIQDVSERKRAEEAILESEQRFRLVAQATDDAILDREPLAGRLWWNDRFEALFGQPPVDDGELFAFWKAHIHPDDRERILSEAPRVLSQPGRSSESEYRWLWEDGRVLHLHERRVVFHDEAGRVARVVITISDHTERKVAEEALRCSEAKFRRVFEANMVGILFWREDGTVEDANDAALELLQVTRAELATGCLNWRAMTPPEYRAADERALAEIAQSGACTPFEKEYVRPDGTRVSAIVAAASLDRQARGVAIILDVTARKTALAALCASEERFRKLIENSYDSVLIMDAGSSVTFTSPATSRILGYDPAEIVGMRLFDIIHPDDLACARSEIHALLANPATTSRAKVRCRAKDGSWHQLETVGRNFFDDPSIAGIVLNSRDLSAA